MSNFGWTETKLKSTKRNYKGNIEMPRCKYFKFKVIENHCKQKGKKNAKKEIATNLFSAQIILKHTLETHPK